MQKQRLRISDFLLLLMLTIIPSAHGLELDEVEPTLGKLGEELEPVMLAGSGFTKEMQVGLSISRFLAGSVDLSGNAKAVATFGSKAYVAAGDEGIKLVDISDPRKPVAEEIIDVGGNACDVAVIGTTVIVALGDTEDQIEQIKALDVSGRSMTVDWTIDAPGAEDIAVLGETLFVAAGSQGLKALDLAAPDYAAVTTIPGTEGASAVAISQIPSLDQTLAYVAVPDHTIHIIQLNQEGRAGGTHISSETGAYYGRILALGAIDDSLYLFYRSFSGANTLKQFTVSAGGQMNSVMSMNMEGATDICLNKNALMITREPDTNSASFHLFNLSTNKSPRFAGTHATGRHPRDVALINEGALVVRDEGLVVIEIDDQPNPEPQDPNAILTTELPDPTAIVVAGGYAFVADKVNGLVILRINPAADPEVVRTIPVEGATAIDLAVQESTLFLLMQTGDGGGLVRGFDVSDPESGIPALPNDLVIPTNIYPSALAIFESSVFVTGSTSVLVGEFNGTGSWEEILRPDGTHGVVCGLALSIFEKYALVAINYYEEDRSWLWVIDALPCSDTYLNTVGLISFSGGAQGVVSHGKMAFVPIVGTWLGGLLAFDISNPNRPYLFDQIVTESNCRQATMSSEGKMIYLLNEDVGMISVPRPELVEIDAVEQAGTRAFLHLPSPIVEGDYKLRVNTATETHNEYTGAVSFRKNAKLFKSRAIIVAGGGPHAPNNLWDGTKHCANLAYDALLKQGYTRDSIFYISMEPHTAEVDRRDATLNNLEHALGLWLGEDTDELLIYFVDHGEPGQFILDVGPSDRQGSGAITKLDVATLAEWLGRLQEQAVTGPQTFVYDACHSGSFLPGLLPAADRERTLIASCAAQEKAFFGQQGVASFSQHFWDSIYAEGNLGVAFDKAENKMFNRQKALLDANGNGKPNEAEDFELARNRTLRRGYHLYMIQPAIQEISTQANRLDEKILITARGVTDAQWVSTQIIPPDLDPQLTSPDTDLPEIQLRQNDDGDYQGVFDDFSVNGTYIVSVRAGREQERYSYSGGSDRRLVVLSTTNYAYINQTTGAHDAPGDEYDLKGDDNLYEAKRIIIGDPFPQQHSFHVQGDADWIRFYGIKDKEYTIETVSLSKIGDTILTLFGETMQTIEAGPVNEGGNGEDEAISFTCTQDGIYRVRITSGNDKFGCSARYELKVSYPPYGPLLAVLISGRVLAPDRSPLSDVGIITSDGGSDISDEEGQFFIRHQAGHFTMTFSSDQFGTKAVDIDVIERGDNYHEVVYGDDLSNPEPVSSSGGGGCFIAHLAHMH